MQTKNEGHRIKCNIKEIKEIQKSKGEVLSCFLIEVTSPKPLQFFITRKLNQVAHLQHMVEL